MKKLFTFLLMILTIGLFGGQAFAQVGSDVTDLTDPQDQEMMTEATKDDGPHFRGGESVWITEDLIGDVYIGGGNVRVEGNIDGDALVGGGTVTISGHITRDLRVGAGQVMIDGIIDGNVSIGAGTVTFSKDSVVRGSVVVGAGQAVFDGNIGGQVYSWVGEVEGNGEFGKNLQGAAGSLRIGPSANVQGDVSFQTDSEPQISDQSMIAGRRDIQIIEKTEEEKSAESWKNGIDAGSFLFKILMVIVSAGILYYFFPDISKTLSKQVLENPLPALGWGMVHLILVPIVAVLFMVTVLGLPVGALIMMAYVIALITAGWIVSFALGQKIYQLSKIEWLKKPFVQIVVGVVVMSLITHIPLIGGLAQLGKLVLGLGAIFILEKEALSKLRLKKLE